MGLKSLSEDETKMKSEPTNYRFTCGSYPGGWDDFNLYPDAPEAFPGETLLCDNGMIVEVVSLGEPKCRSGRCSIRRTRFDTASEAELWLESLVISPRRIGFIPNLVSLELFGRLVEAKWSAIA